MRIESPKNEWEKFTKKSPSSSPLVLNGHWNNKSFFFHLVIVVMIMVMGIKGVGHSNLPNSLHDKIGLGDVILPRGDFRDVKGGGSMSMVAHLHPEVDFFKNHPMVILGRLKKQDKPSLGLGG
jgi:hypothetical protein